MTNTLDTLSQLIDKAMAAGADAADAIAVDGRSVSVRYRLGKLEQLDGSEGGDIGLRVLIGKQMAMVSSEDRKPAALETLVERAIAMAKTVPEDPHCGLAEPDQLLKDLPEIDLCDPQDLAEPKLIEMAAEAEDAARAVEGVNNSNGSEAGFSRNDVVMAASNGFQRSYETTGASLSVSVLAGTDETGMETDYDYTSAVYASDMRSPQDIGREAGERTVKRLGAKKAPSKKLPLIFDRRAARGLVSHVLGAINGASIARGVSFLKDHMGEAVFPDGISIIEDPHRARGVRSRPCDAEGLPNQRRALIDNGQLTTWLLDLRAARQLELEPTGHAVRGTGGPPSPAPSNVWMEAGSISPAAMIADIKEGLYLTDVWGQGVNMVTGDYSRGVFGYWIENGELTHPVNETTIAGNLKDMFMNLTPADDLKIEFGTEAPTVRIDGMSVAGA